MTRSPEEHDALRALLAAAKHAEMTAGGQDRRPAHRLTRSLLAAARVCGFTLDDLAKMTGVTADSVRTRSGVLDPVPRSRFLALLPAHAREELPAPPAAADTVDPADAVDPAEDPVELLTWYLSAVFVSAGKDAS
ncbi:hypothetical protein [Curtobacterium sp. L1-20]|uniref:hypothetical protein n=1 Tax=Curtobacterium sp. L1-20 TaxID=3138181 RepID=UPI003B51D9F7